MSPIYYDDGTIDDTEATSPCWGCGEPGGGRYSAPGCDPCCWECYQELMGGDGSISEPGETRSHRSQAWHFDDEHEESRSRVWHFDDEHAGINVLRELDVEKMLSTAPPPVPWIVEPILARGCVTMLAGREGRGKSMLALALAAAIGKATNLLDVAGMPVGISGHVLYVDAENGEHEAHRRIHGLGVQSGMLTYIEANGFDLKQHLVLLEELVRKHQPKVLILDSLRSLAPALDENDSQQAEAALRPIIRLTQQEQDDGQPRMATMVLHHASRMSGEYRGSTALGAAVELGFTLSRIEDDPMAGTRRKLACWKSRPAAEPEPRWLTIKPDAGGDILLMDAAPYEPPARAPVRDEIEEVLRELIGGVSGVTPHMGDDTLTPGTGVRSWSTADFAREVGRDPKDATVRRAAQRLEDAGLIHRNGDGRWWRAEEEEK